MNGSETCHDQRRRDDVRRAELNGIDYLEVSDDGRELAVHFLGKAPAGLTVANIRIEGGRRVTGIRAVDVRLCAEDDPDLDDCLLITVDRPGDFSIYTLRLVNPDARGRPGTTPLDGLDPRYAQITFSFTAGCASDLDCQPMDVCPPELRDEPQIDYLAKDYASFRRLIYDRLALIMPSWTERHVPDLGVTLVELLAYAGDHLSYYQDAVATEAYLDTARRRVSVRRHAWLVDFQMHEGVNARAWVHINTDDDQDLPTGDYFFITGANEDLPIGGSVLAAEALRDLPFSRYEVFEPLLPDLPVALRIAHNAIPFYTWGDRECCLPRGATAATLLDTWTPALPDPGGGDDCDDPPAEQPGYPAAQAAAKHSPPAPPAPPRGRTLHLKAGDVLIFEEIRDPKTGEPADANPSHRHAVRLTRVELAVDTLYDKPVVEISWDAGDALPFALCISAIARAPECKYYDDISVARGNIILVDHGRTIADEPLPVVPPPLEHDAGCEAEGEPRETMLGVVRYRPRLDAGPLTQRAPFPEPAAVARQQAMALRALLPRIQARALALLAQVRDGQALSAEQLAELRAIFGPRALIEAGLTPAPTEKRRRRHETTHDQVAALERLLARAETYLHKKARRVATLVARADAGYVLGETIVQEIAELFGEQYAEDVRSDRSARYGSAAAALLQQPTEALPDARLFERRQVALPGQPAPPPPAADQTIWLPQPDLLRSGPCDAYFVAEIEDERAQLRFGDGSSGRAPEAGTTFFATYRVGNGTAGNVGPEAISRIVFRNTSTSGWLLFPRNPLPAAGGLNPQPLAEVKLYAPTTFRKDMRRAITADDYARLAERDPRVQRAAAVLRWTGSWYQVRVAIDPRAQAEADTALLEAIERSLAPYRRIGHDLAVVLARYVPLEIELIVCVRPSFLRGHVKAALIDVFGNRRLPDGRYGFFHPDALTFGAGIALSRLVAAAQAIEGVETVKVATLQRLGQGANGELERGLLAIGPQEIARLDNDPNRPENGKLVLTLRGGR